MSGGLAGVAGALEVAGPIGQLTAHFPVGYGFAAIIVAFVGRLHPFGVVAFNPGTGTLPDDFPYAHFRLLRWQAGADRVEFKPGISLPLAPFFGSIGVAPPPLARRISSRPPGWHGGNLDNKDLVAGSTLYLPVHVPGALLSVGDGHAMQGHGEVTGCVVSHVQLRSRTELTQRQQVLARVLQRAQAQAHRSRLTQGNARAPTRTRS